MRLFRLIIIPGLIALSFSCTSNLGRSNEKLSIEITHFSGAIGLTTYFMVDDSLVQVDTNCDFQDCKRQTVYKRGLTLTQRDSLLRSLKALHLENLKKKYTPDEIVYDGLVSIIKIKGPGLPTKTISIDNVNLPTINNLNRIIDNLILIKKYQFYNSGQ